MDVFFSWYGKNLHALKLVSDPSYICPAFMTTNTIAKSRGTRYLADILLGVLPLLLGAQVIGWVTFFPSALRGHSDFRQLYAAGYMVRIGHASELYDYRAQETFQGTLVGNDQRALPFIRPAYQALLFPSALAAVVPIRVPHVFGREFSSAGDNFLATTTGGEEPRQDMAVASGFGVSRSSIR